MKTKATGSSDRLIVMLIVLFTMVVGFVLFNVF
jgi:hypothetical protein